MSRKVNKTQDLFSAMDFEDNTVVEKSQKEILVDDKENLISEEKYKDLTREQVEKYYYAK